MTVLQIREFIHALPEVVAFRAKVAAAHASAEKLTRDTAKAREHLAEQEKAVAGFDLAPTQKSYDALVALEARRDDARRLVHAFEQRTKSAIDTALCDGGVEAVLAVQEALERELPKLREQASTSDAVERIETLRDRNAALETQAHAHLLSAISGLQGMLDF